MTKRFQVTGARLLMVAASFVVIAVVAVPAASTAKATPKYYVSLGDSYSVGYQPSPTSGATSGYTGYVAKKLKMQLENFGCGGATTASILNTVGCAAPYGPPAATDAVAYPAQTQVAAADAFITAHPGQIGLITVSIGGNDVTSCASAANPVGCVSTASGTIRTNVTTLANDLRTAAGAGVPIIGLTYPDVFLGEWVYPSFPASSADQTLATESVTAFQSLINPALDSAYTSVSGTFVDVTTATDAYVPLTTLANLKPYGKIPKAVVEVCKLTWFCKLGNIHANTTGYTDIGKLITKAVS
jgi:lysophospholipase L1-like esterase